MNKEQIKNLITKIKGYYPSFKLNDLSLNEWYKELAKYDEYDVLNSLENYVNRGSDYYPKLNQLLYHLKTRDDKENSDVNKLLVDCPLCRRTIKNRDFDLHYRKCLMIKTIINLENKEGRYPTYEELDSINYYQLSEMYDKINPLNIDEIKKRIIRRRGEE